MLIKIYEEIKRIIKENYKFLLFMIITICICSIEFPYYIQAPGGIINIEDRIDVEDGYDSKGSLNMAYVSEYKAIIPTMIISKINKNWELIKRETNNSNTTSEADYYRNHIMLEEANQNAIIVAYNAANLQVKKKNTKLYVTYVYEEADTDIEIKDQILEINGVKVVDKIHLKEILQTISIDEKIDILVENDEEEIHRTATLTEYNDNYILGIVVSEISDIEVKPNVEFDFHSSESGPSGGLMMSLAIYNAITKEDITNGNKIVGTGTIDSEGNVGEIDGVEYKLKAAVKEDADIFIVPSGRNYEEVKAIMEEENYDIDIISVNTFNEALDYLKSN